MDDDECIICFEQLNNEICILNCKHRYHYDCLVKWIEKSNNISNLCTICNKRSEIINIININDSNNTNVIQDENNNKKKKGCCNIL